MTIHTSPNSVDTGLHIINEHWPDHAERAQRGIQFARENLVPQNKEAWMVLEDDSGASMVCTRGPDANNQILMVNDYGLFIVTTYEQSQEVFQKNTHDISPLLQASKKAAEGVASGEEGGTGVLHTYIEPNEECGFVEVTQVDWNRPGDPEHEHLATAIGIVGNLTEVGQIATKLEGMADKKTGQYVSAKEDYLNGEPVHDFLSSRLHVNESIKERPDMVDKYASWQWTLEQDAAHPGSLEIFRDRDKRLLGVRSTAQTEGGESLFVNDEGIFVVTANTEKTKGEHITESFKGLGGEMAEALWEANISEAGKFEPENEKSVIKSVEVFVPASESSVGLAKTVEEIFVLGEKKPIEHKSMDEETRAFAEAHLDERLTRVDKPPLAE